MAGRPFQLHARKEIVTVELIDRPVTSFATRDAAEEEAALWAKAGFSTEVVDTSKGETPTITENPDAHHDADAVVGTPTEGDAPDDGDAEPATLGEGDGF
jgi:hypothetical protein